MRRILTVSTLSIVVAAGMAELGLRFLLFSDSPLAERFGKDLRRPALYAHFLDDDHWRLHYLFYDRKKKRTFRNADAEIGWVPPPVDLGAVESQLGPRKLVVLFGDSYARCQTPPEECWEGLLERSDLRDRYMLLNRGVAGYGLDQTYLLMKRSLDELARFDPIVVIGIYVDEDLDRCALGIHRLPKVRFELDGDRLLPSGPVLTDLEQYIAAHPVSLDSYLWKLVAARPPPPSERIDDPRVVEEKMDLTRALVREIQRELESRSVEHFFVLFLGEWSLQQERTQWRERVLHESFQELGVPFVSSRNALCTTADPPSAYFGGHPRLDGHYNALGNEVVFHCIRDGIEHRFESSDAESAERPPSRSLLDLFPSARYSPGGDGAVARPGRGIAYPFTAPEDAERLVLCPGAAGPTEIVFPLDGGFSRLTATAKVGAQPFVLVVRVDDDEVLRERVDPGSPLPLAVDVHGARELSILVDHVPEADARTAGGMYLASPRLE